MWLLQGHTYIILVNVLGRVLRNAVRVDRKLYILPGGIEPRARCERNFLKELFGWGIINIQISEFHILLGLGFQDRPGWVRHVGSQEAKGEGKRGVNKDVRSAVSKQMIDKGDTR